MTEAGSAPPSPRPGPAKGPAAFRTISEASSELGVPQHVLRFWETRFAFIRPTKRAGGRRFYRPQDLDVLRGVRTLLQDEGYTIRGVQKLHREQGLKRLLAAAGVGESVADRLAAEVEPAPTPAPVIAPPDVDAEEDDGPGTRDLFPDEACAFVPPEQAAAAPPSASTGARDAGRPVLEAGARARLSEVLSDLEATKAEIDALLQVG